MHFSTVATASALAATAIAAPGPQFGRPAQYGRPSSAVGETCAGPTATSTAFVTITEKGASTTTIKSNTFTSTATIVDPSGSTWTSTSTVVGPVGTTLFDPTGTCSEQTATLIRTATPVTVTVTEGATYPGGNSTGTAVVPTSTVTVTETAPFPTGNASVPALPTSTGTPKKCITPAESEDLAEVFRLLIQEYSDGLALAALTEDFIDYSSAVNILMNKGAQYPKNISGPTFASRAAFMSGQGSQPKIPFERLVTTYGCDSVAVRWWTSRSGNGQKTEAAMIPVFGNGIMQVVPSTDVQTWNGVTYNWRVKVLISEFNTAAWLVNLGVFKPVGPVDYINATNTTVKRSEEDFNFDFQGAMI